MEFYEKFKEIKKDNRLTWKDLAVVVHKNATAMRLAFVNKSLNLLEQKALEEHFVSKELHNKKTDYGFTDSEEGILTEISEGYRKTSVDDIVRYIVYNEETLMDNPMFKNFIMKHAYEIAIGLSKK